MKTKWLRRRVIASRPVSSVIRSLEQRRGPRGPGSLIIPMFHRTFCAERFGEQIDVLLDGRTCVRGAEVVASLHGGPKLPDSAVWLTFDDSYLDFRDVAWPVLESRGLTATQFVATGFVGGSSGAFWWDRLEAGLRNAPSGSIELPLVAGGTMTVAVGPGFNRWKRVRDEIKLFPHATAMEVVEQLIRDADAPHASAGAEVMGWDDLRSLMARGLEIGGHTRDHPMLDRLTGEAAEAEIRTGFKDLSERLDASLPVLAYPSGQFNDDVIRATKRAAIPFAVTTINGVNSMDALDPHRLLRVPIGPLADGAAVRLRLLLAARRNSARQGTS